MKVAQNRIAPASEASLRKVITELQRGVPDASSFEPGLWRAIQAQAQATSTLLAGLGSVRNIAFTGTQDGLDVYEVTFEHGATIWQIGMSSGGRIAGLLFRPNAVAETSGDEVGVSGLSGTLLKPAGVDRPPVVLLIAGSGPTDRNGNQGASGPGELRQLAEQLAQHGIASLRYDKRGIGRSFAGALREEEFTINSFVEDAIAWLNWLEQRSDLGSRIVAGHSEGGLIALLVAKRVPLSGIVLITTPGRPLGAVLRDQLERSSLTPTLKVEAFTVLSALEREEDVADVSPALQPLFRRSVQPFLRSVLSIDPARELGALKLPVLIVSGGRDLQVGPEDARRLAESRRDAARFDLAEMNHVLKIAPADADGQGDLYSNPNVPLAPGLSQAVATFIDEIATSSHR